MKIERVPSLFSFNPHNIVSNHEIFGKRQKVISATGEVVEEKAFTDDGLFSPVIFGSFETEHDYSCKCKHLVGKFYDGMTCPKCGNKVEYTESHIDKTGWIDLSGNKYKEDGTVAEFGPGFKIIKYIAYLFLEKLIGRKNLKNIIHVPNIITVSGELDTDSIKEIQNENPQQKYWYIGLTEFYKNYNDIIAYYYSINNVDDEKLFEFLYDPAEVFTDKIPVISTILRPAVRTADGLKLDVLNSTYVRLIKNVKLLNSNVSELELIRNSTLEIIQAEYFQLSEEILNNIKGKDGLIRNQICGTRIDFSARNIITPLKAGFGMNEVVMPYITFLELYKFEIINILHKVKNISIREAEIMHFNAKLNFNREIYLIMKKMIKEEECSILLNRNPTIALGSILYMRIADVKEDMNDLTLSLHNSVLTLLAGDYDGDVLNIISLKDSEMKQVFKEIISPSSLIVDSNNGNINKSLLLERDQVLGLNSLLF